MVCQFDLPSLLPLSIVDWGHLCLGFSQLTYFSNYHWCCNPLIVILNTVLYTNFTEYSMVFLVSCMLIKHRLSILFSEI